MTGACLQTDSPIPLETIVTIYYPKGQLAGKVTRCEYKDIGYFVGVEFDEGMRWSQSAYKPRHLLDPRRLAARDGKKVN